MATETKEQRDKRIEEATSIKGAMPRPNSLAAEQAKWDAKGNLIDPDAVAEQKRRRDILLGKKKPTLEDFDDTDFGKRVMNIAASPSPGADIPASASITPPPSTVPKVDDEEFVDDDDDSSKTKSAKKKG